MAMRRFLLIAVSALSICGLSRATDPTFSITISTSRPIAQLGSEVRVSILLKNISSHPIDIERSPRTDLGEQSYEVEVRDERGNKLPETKYYRVTRGKEKDDSPRPDGKFSPPKYIGGSFLSKTVEPGETFPDGMILNKLIDIVAPGKYRITVRRFDEATKSYVSSNTITLTERQ